MGAKRKDSSTPEPASMSRRALIKAILHTKCDFPVDFTADYLHGLTLEKLRHIYVALREHAGNARPPSRR